MTLILVLLGGAVGAPLRYLTDRALQRRVDAVLPLGTLIVNLTGAALLGFLATGVALHTVSASAMALLGTGLCGALTTYSTLSYETVRLARDGAGGYALVSITANLVGGLISVAAGAGLAQLLWS